jgi:hypothetical protein
MVEIMRVVNHQPDIVPFGECHKLSERRAVAIHREHALGYDQRVPVRAAMLDKQRPDVVCIIMAEGLDP